MIINGQTTEAKLFAYDGCHKIYLIESDGDLQDAKEAEYEILPISDLEETFEESCELRFINSWDLEKTYVVQFEEAEITH